MRFQCSFTTRRRFLWAGGLSVALYGVTPAWAATPAVIPRTAAAPAPSEVITRYMLGEAIAIGRANHPSLAALRASAAAATLKIQGLKEVSKGLGGLLPEIDYRRQQSDVGLQAAQVELAQAEHEVTYAVIRCYYSIVYAREQAKVAKDLVDQLDVYLDQVKKIVNSKGGGVKGITKDTEDKLVGILKLAAGKMIEAETAVDRARAALREAMGVDMEGRVDAADEMLPEVKAEVTRAAVVAHATTRRGEVALAGFGASAARLEVCAQWSRRLLVEMPTFANGGDIHARSVPGATREPDYKPGAIGPEMPGKMLGKRATRTETARQYAERADAAAKQARHLIALEAEIGHSRWDEATRKVENFREAAARGKDLIDRQREASGGNLTKEDMLMNEVSATQSQAAFNEALYHQILSLANLERITAGGVHVNFPGR